MTTHHLPIVAGAMSLLIAASVASATAGFYDVTAADLAGPPGSLIRVEGMANVNLTSAMAYRILYRSTGLDGKPIAVSGFVVAPDRSPPASGWPVVAWAHPTTGIARKCAPSMLPHPVATIPGINQMIERKFVIVATDYPGLGGPGVHPYLVGVSEGRAVLDSVRAAREMREARAGVGFTVWGHSQGGHAALWAGELVAKYAPELKLLGVAAAAPASELAALFEDDVNTLSGDVLSAMVLASWSKVFGAPLDPLIVPSELTAVHAVGQNCIELIAGELGDLSAKKSMPKQFLKADPTRIEPWKGLIAKNTPGRAAAGAPVFIAQGSADTTVDPAVTVAFVRKLCGQGTPVEFLEYKNLTHTQIAKASAGKAVAWMSDRFYGKAAPSNCR